MKVWDCFTYFNEKECLEIRMAELHGLNITHVIVQSNRTFTGNPKQTYNTDFPNCRNVYVDDMPDNCDAWTREAHQRNAIMRGLYDANDEDLVIIADADEIPRKAAIESYKPEMGITSLRMDNFWYKFNCLIGKQEWTAAKMLQYKDLKNTLPDTIRRSGQQTVLDWGGWHYSYCGDAAFISNKLQSFSHIEHNTDDAKNLSEIQRKVDAGQALWGDAVFQYVPLESTDYVMRNQERFKHLIKEL